MTCREKLSIEYPEDVDSEWGGGCFGCPHDYNYAEKPYYCDGDGNDDKTCTDCWNRKVKETKKKEENEMRKEFTKADLKSDLEFGMVVELRDKSKMVVTNYKGKIRLVGDDSFIDGNDVRDDLTVYVLSECEEDKDSMDIIRVFEPSDYATELNDLIYKHGKLLWERIEEITIEELLQMAEKRKGCKVKLVEGERNIK